jgi:hypothetical protein
MPLIRKIIDVGKTSRGIILPKSWLRFHEQKNGKEIREIGMEIDGRIVIWPILNEWE